MNEGGQFKFAVGQRVVYAPQGNEAPRRVKIVDRTIEPALGKTYRIRFHDGKFGGYVRETELSPLVK